MKRIIPFTLALAALALSAAVLAAQEAPKKTAPPVVVMETNMGTMEITLNPDKAPITVRNFLSYVNEGFYDKTIFHRVIIGFMIQGGGFTRNMSEKKTKPTIKNEAANGLKNTRGTIAMARTDDINSATAQFFINHKDNPFLDHKDNTPNGFGYAVFGEVTKGIEVVDKIAAVKTGAEDVPVKPVIILSVKLKK
jgi:cyclophilin family peptidyl-prolyl cis-trans isomerase